MSISGINAYASLILNIFIKKLYWQANILKILHEAKKHEEEIRLLQ